MTEEKIIDGFETFYMFFTSLFILLMISGSWVAFIANLCIALVGVGLTFVSVYIIIGVCKIVEDSLKGVNYSGTSK